MKKEVVLGMLVLTYAENWAVAVAKRDTAWARGYMQLLKRTARRLARRKKLI
jgi:soluble lytic murein transglycosylase-like protein